MNRSLSLICDMCIVDLTNDIRTNSPSSNWGSNRDLLFAPVAPANDGQDSPESQEPEDMQPPDNLEDMERDSDGLNGDIQDNLTDMEQQMQDDMPGEDEPEMYEHGGPYYHPEEYPENQGEYSQGQQNVDLNQDTDWKNDPDIQNWLNEPDSGGGSEENPEEDGSYMRMLRKHGVSRSVARDSTQLNPNSLLLDFKLDSQELACSDDELEYSDATDELFDEVVDCLMELGQNVVREAETPDGWIGEADSGAVSCVVSTASPTKGVATDETTGDLMSRSLLRQISRGPAQALMGLTLDKLCSGEGYSEYGLSSSDIAQEEWRVSVRDSRTTQLFVKLWEVLGSSFSDRYLSFGTVSMDETPVATLRGMLNHNQDLLLPLVCASLGSLDSGEDLDGLANRANAAAKRIFQEMKLVEDVATSVLAASEGVASNAIDDFGKLVMRMTVGKANRMTPVETYVGLVSKRNTKSGTLA